MPTFQGFRPFKEMVDNGQLRQGATIGVSKSPSLSYTVLGAQQEGKHIVYRVKHTFPVNAKNLLHNAEWYVKEP